MPDPRWPDPRWPDANRPDPNPARAVLSVEIPDPTTFVIRVGGALDGVTATRLLRLLDSRLDLPTGGRAGIRTVLVDLSAVRHVRPGGLVPLRHARYICRRRAVDLAILGAEHLIAGTAPVDRAELARHRLLPAAGSAADGGEQVS